MYRARFIQTGGKSNIKKKKNGKKVAPVSQPTFQSLITQFSPFPIRDKYYRNVFFFYLFHFLPLFWKWMYKKDTSVHLITCNLSTHFVCRQLVAFLTRKNNVVAAVNPFFFFSLSVIARGLAHCSRSLFSCNLRSSSYRRLLLLLFSLNQQVGAVQ